MSLKINDLNDDCLIQIFRYLPLSSRLDLPFVCKRFYSVCKNYELNAVQKRLGIVYEQNCGHFSHHIDEEDTIFNLVIERRNSDHARIDYFNPKTSLNKFELSRPMFDQLLMRCTKLKVLSLRLVNAVDNRIINSIIKHSHYLEHLTISTTTIQVTNLVWLELCSSVCSKLKCLNLEYVDNMTDHFISNILRKSILLENFAITGNNQQLHGYFFENLCNQIKSISIRKVDTFTDHGIVALMSLIAGNGRKVRKLVYKGRLSGDFLNQINLMQKNFKQLEDLEIGDSLDDVSAPFQRILGQTIGRISSLKKIAFSLPQLTPFTITLNSLFIKLVELNRPSNLIAFKLNGGEISDKSIELLCKNFMQINEFHLAHSSYFARENFSLTNRIFTYLSGLKELRILTINGLALDDYLLSSILNNCTHLNRLDLRNCWLLTNRVLVDLEHYANKVAYETILVYLWGTQVSLLKLDERQLFTYPSNLRLSFEPLQENLMDFDIIEDDGFDFI